MSSAETAGLDQPTRHSFEPFAEAVSHGINRGANPEASSGGPLPLLQSRDEQRVHLVAVLVADISREAREQQSVKA